MDINEFRSKVRNYPFFRSSIFTSLSDKPAALRNQVKQWVDKGYLLCLKRGIYTLNTEDRKVGLSLYCLANYLYTPSYVSLETALSFYGLIPERVDTITSVTTKKTQTFQNDLGCFRYRNIQKSNFRDFIVEKDEQGNTFQIATPEKALLDFLYYQLRGVRSIKPNIFSESFRLQNLDILNPKKLQQIANKYQSAKMNMIVKVLFKYLEDN